MSRLTEGFVVAPWTSAFTGAIVIAIIARDPGAGVVMALGCLPVGYAAILLFGLPLFQFWKRRAWFSALAICSLGTVSALLITIPVSLLTARRNQTPWFVDVPHSLVISMPLGLVGGLTLWWFGIRGNIALTRSLGNGDKPIVAIREPR